jgi:hypothetical protein
MLNEVERNNVVLERSRLFCPMERNNEEMFFSLVDYRNNYFTSDDPDKIIEFYFGFENRDHLIQWMKERPKGVANIYEIDGEKDIIVVIPTADFNGKYANECKENIFKGLQMVFVESGGRGDFYFNIAHNVNVGIKKAKEYNPKWIVVSGDDMVKVDEVGVLKEGLSNLDSDEVGLVYAYPPSNYHSLEECVARGRITRNIIRIILRGVKKDRIYDIKKRNEVEFLIVQDKPMNRFLYQYKFRFIDTIAFGIYSNKMLTDILAEATYIFDCNFINCHEESDLAIRVSRSKWKSAKVEYKIKPLIGESLGRTNVRTMRDLASGVYFSKKFSEL